MSLLASVVGAAAGWRSGRRSRPGPRPDAGRGTSTPLPPAIGRRLSLGWLTAAVGIVIVLAWANVDQDARRDVRALARGGAQSDVSALFAPLDVRLVRVEWKDPSPTRRALPQRALLVSRAHGRLVFVESNRTVWDLPASDLVVTSP